MRGHSKTRYTPNMVRENPRKIIQIIYALEKQIKNYERLMRLLKK